MLGVVYAVVTLAGLLSLRSQSDPVGQPYMVIMEVLILLLAPLMAVGVVCIHYYISRADRRLYSIAAVLFMSMMAAITSSVHFVILIIGSGDRAAQWPGYASLLAFRWPSLVYVLDILAWDWFYALAMLLAAAAMPRSRGARILRWLMVAGGLLALVGLCGVPTGNMQVRNTGIIGYAVVGPVIFLRAGILIRNKNVTSPT